MQVSSAPPIVSLRSASFGYAGRAVVSDVSFDISPGEIVAILGPNGSGKSTLMRGILGLNDHVAGDVELFGTPAAKFREHTRLGYVPQRHTLSASVRATVNEIVEVGRLPHRRWYQRATGTDRQYVVDALEQVGLRDRARDDVSTLSGGQHRRVLIARALAGQPDVLVMDEPTAGVDTTSQEVLANVLERLATTGVTMIIVTHEVEALAPLLTRIIEVTHGSITFDDTPETYAQRVATNLNAAPGSMTHPLHVPGSHDAHHDDDEAPGRPPLAAGPLDGSLIAKEPHHG